MYDIMVIKPRKPAKVRKPVNRAKARKSANERFTCGPIKARIEGLHLAYDFLRRHKDRIPELEDVRKACIETLLEGLKHQNEDVWVEARKLYENLKRKKRI